MQDILKDLQEPLNQLIVFGVVLAFRGLGYFVRLLSGYKRVHKQQQKWNWYQFRDGLLDRSFWIMAAVCAIVACDMFWWLAPALGLNPPDEVKSIINAAVVIAIPLVAGLNDLYYGILGLRKTSGWDKNLKSLGMDEAHIVPSKADIDAIAESTIESIKRIADSLTPKHTVEDKQTNNKANPTEEEIEFGQGSGDNPLNRRLSDGDNCGGKGWQCSKYSWYLATGIIMNYAPHPDYGPVNGNVMVDYLVSKLGWVRCGKENGAIFSYNAGKYGHTGLVVDAAKNIVNDANWTPLKTSTHYLNLDAVEATYCKPKSMIATQTNSQDNRTSSGQSSDMSTPVKPVVSGQISGKLKSNIKKGDYVKVIKHVDVNGTILLNLQDKYLVYQTRKSDQTAVLKTDDGDIYARMSFDNIEKVK